MQVGGPDRVEDEVRSRASQASLEDEEERIRTAFERSVRALSLRPGRGRGTAVTRVRLGEGLTCEVEDGPWRLVVSMPEKVGGAGAGPNPGVVGRAALGSCLAVGYRMWAARRGVPLRSLTVEVEADYDVRGELGVDRDVSPAYSEIRLVVSVESEASESRIEEVLAEAEAHSPYWRMFERPTRIVRRLRHAGGEA